MGETAGDTKRSFAAMRALVESQVLRNARLVLDVEVFQHVPLPVRVKLQHLLNKFTGGTLCNDTNK
jgi:hypothetical protein